MLRIFLVIVFIMAFHNNLFALELKNLKVNILRGDYKQAISEGEKALATIEESRELDELYYLLGLSYLKDGNYLRASDIFEIILKEFPDSKFKDESQLGIGDTQLLRANLSKAQDIYEELLRERPNTKLKAQLIYRLSQIALKKGDSNQAKVFQDMLRQEFPSNPELVLNKDIDIVIAKATPPAISTAAIEVYYTVQVGSFSKKDNAENLVQKLTQQGYPAYIEEVTSDQNPSYRVRVGKLSSRQEAANLEEKLSKEGYPTKVFP